MFFHYHYRLQRLLLVGFSAYHAMAFSADSSQRVKGFMARLTVLSAISTEKDRPAEHPISCFVTNAWHVEEDGATPRVVCTSEPDAYAWMEGIDRDAMRQGLVLDHGVLWECVEGASPRGTPEWECRMAFDAPIQEEEEDTEWM